MKADPISTIAIIGVSCLLATVPTCSARAQEPSLSETLSWIESTYNDHSETSGPLGHGIIITKFHHEFDALLKRQSFGYDGCIVTLHKEVNDRDDDVDNGTMIKSDIYNDIFDLKDIDPTSVRPVCSLDGWTPSCQDPAIVFSTKDQRQLITKTKVDPKGQKKPYGTILYHSYDYFIVDDYDYSLSLVKAFRRAVELCGGKPSVF